MSKDKIFNTEWWRMLMKKKDLAVKLYKGGNRKEANKLFYEVKVIFDKRIPNPV